MAVGSRKPNKDEGLTFHDGGERASECLIGGQLAEGRSPFLAGRGLNPLLLFMAEVRAHEVSSLSHEEKQRSENGQDKESFQQHFRRISV